MITDIGDVAEVSTKSIRVGDRVPAGQLLVDGLGVGDVGSEVLSDRKHLAEEGLFVVTLGIDGVAGRLMSVDVCTRGFVYMSEDSEIVGESKELIKRRLESADLKCQDYGALKSGLRKELKNLIFKKTKRNPMILTTIVDCCSGF